MYATILQKLKNKTIVMCVWWLRKQDGIERAKLVLNGTWINLLFLNNSEILFFKKDENRCIYFIREINLNNLKILWN